MLGLAKNTKFYSQSQGCSYLRECILSLAIETDSLLRPLDDGPESGLIVVTSL